MKIGNYEFQLGKRTYIMGILNVTPDSFSDGGKFCNLDAALMQVDKMLQEGADIIDIGGESTRPGHIQISEEEEIKRVVPIIRKIKECFTVPVSIDTYKSLVCKEALEAGADMINDIWGFLYDEKMASLAADYDVPCCLMHNRNTTQYHDFLHDFIEDLSVCVETALRYGVKKENIILDPGIGFGKTYEQNLEIIKNLEVIKEHFSYPVMLAASRKSMIAKALLDAPVEQRVIGTVTTTAIGISKGCDFVRVHDVKENKEACLMADAIFRR